MHRIMGIRNYYFEFGSRTRVFLSFLILFNTTVLFSQTQPTNKDKSSSGNIEGLKKKVNQFLSMGESNPMTRNPHIYYNISIELLSHDVLLDLTERVVLKGIEVNTYENLTKIHPNRSSIGHQQKLEFGRLYSQYAWVLWKKGQRGRAHTTILKAMSYKASPNPEDCLRWGIIEYGAGRKESGWNRIIDALMKDTIVEE